MRELEEVIIPYLKSPNDLDKVRPSLTKPTVKNLVLESRVRRVVYSNGYIEIEREWLALTVRDTKVARPGLIVDLLSEDFKVLN
jgi:hypothetical protein